MRQVSKNDLGMVEGWRYSVTTEKDSRSKGVFRGYAMLGSESAIVLQMTEGVTRLIPISRVIYIDLLEAGERGKKEEKKLESVYYG
ncbi:MAG: hypothetical protein FWG58_03710 [Methanomassiliicoccaceae archaeon]|nr:hypothetical protein [Methanomassiliicoccaceae archaeon]